MPAQVSDPASGDQTYEEREAVALFDDEKSLNAAVDALMQAGLRQEDMSLLAHSKRLDGTFRSAEELEDRDDTARKAFVSDSSRTEGLAAIGAVPVLLAGMGAAAIVGTGGAALLPTIAITAGSTAAGGALGLVLARAFGRKHADHIQDQILNGGLLLWVHAPDTAKDATIVGILKANGARDVHFHVVTRSWGVADIPLHDFNPDPLLR